MDLTNPETYSRLLAIGEDLSILIGVWNVPYLCPVFWLKNFNFL